MKTSHEPNDKRTSGAHVSLWMSGKEPLRYGPPSADRACDVVIVGGGISGVSCAYMLSREGYHVILVEDGYIGSGETGRTTAHLVNALDDRYFDIEKRHGKEVAALAAQSHTAAIDQVEKICLSERIDCDFKRLPGYLFLHPSDKESSLEKEHVATHRAGINTQLLKETPGVKTSSASLLFPDQAQFHPLRYVIALCEKIVERKGEIYTGTHAREISEKGIVTDKGIRINARYVIVATNTPVNNRFIIHTKQAAYRTYVIAGLIKKGTLKPALWWDTGDQRSKWPNYPYHYVRIQEYNDQYDVLICGGEDHKTGQADKEDMSEEYRYSLLESWVRNHFPDFGEVIHRWSGQVMEPVDCLAFIGKNPGDENIFVVTGDSGNGMTHGTIAGMLLTDLIAGRPSPWKDVYDPGRINWSSVTDFIQENANVAAQYKDFFTPGDLSGISELEPENGAVIRKGLSKVAAYKDATGNVHLFSAVCPHLGCIVDWNRDEKTFDCPCHGSRFSCLGKVMNGPANKDLEILQDLAPHNE